ncbi:MAG: hypothetical protein JSR77_07565 [Planctomycetes bacterium]|nr:hypothetical protein [Planctomycetota bacterium]
MYDSTRGTVVLYGGAFGVFPDYTELEDTLDLFGNAWVARPIPSPCPKRWEYGWTFDQARGVMVLNGGASFVGIPGNPNNHHIGGTYELNGNAWTLKTFGGPDARHGTMLAYDTRRNRVVLFGGKHDVVGTWEWDGQRWTAMNPPSPVPPPRAFGGFAFDERRGKTVLFGGADNSFNAIGDVWEWDGAGWVQITSPTPPPARRGHIMVYDSFRQVCVVFGGTGPTGYTNQIWEYDGTSWIQRIVAGTAPVGRDLFGFAYDRGRNRFVLAGGQKINGQHSDTWELRGDPYVQTPPTAVSVRAGESAELSVETSGATPRTLRWRRGGADLADDGRVSGSATEHLAMTNCGPSDAGLYDVVITTSCGTFSTFPVRFDVVCPSDFNSDGGVDGGDVDAFYASWAAGGSQADFNGDGGIDGSDVHDFFQRWEAGC